MCMERMRNIPCVQLELDTGTRPSEEKLDYSIHFPMDCSNLERPPFPVMDRNVAREVTLAGRINWVELIEAVYGGYIMNI